MKAEAWKTINEAKKKGTARRWGSVHKALTALWHAHDCERALTDDGLRLDDFGHVPDVHIQGHHRELEPADARGNPHFTQAPDLAATIDEKNGWTEPGESVAPEVAATNARFTDAAEMLGTILRWLAEANTMTSMALRAFALIDALRPDLLEGRGSRSDVAQELGVCRQAIQRYSTDIFNLSRGIFMRGCAEVTTSEARERRRKIAEAYHARAGHEIHQPAPSKERKLRPFRLACGPRSPDGKRALARRLAAGQ